MFPLFSHAMQTQLRFRISQQIVTEIYDQIFTLIYPDFKIKFFEAKREVKAKRLLQPPHKTIFDEITINTMMHREGALYVPLHCGFLHFTEKFQAIRT